MSQRNTGPSSRPQGDRRPPPTTPGDVPSAPAARRQGQRRSPEVRQQALERVADGMRPSEVARSLGISGETLRLWRRRAEAEGTVPEASRPGEADATEERVEPEPIELESNEPEPDPGPAPHSTRDPGQGLGQHEVDAILDWKKRNPSMGPAQIRAQLKRFHGWRVSVRAIGRELEKAGYALVHTASRPKGDEEPRRWEAPRRNAIWQMDFAELRVGPERVSLLLIEDDFSRFIVGHALAATPSSEVAVEALRATIARHGKPEAVYTDRGGAFLAWRQASDFQRFLEHELIDHHVSPSYRPQGRGKVEALIHTVQRELWQIEHFESADHARDALARWIAHYNHRRAHLGLDGLTPADRFFARADEVLARMQAASRQRQGALLRRGDDPFVEDSGPDVPVEVLRLIVVDGRMELRFAGHRVALGALQM